MSMTPTTEEAKTKGQEPMSTRAHGAVGAGKSFQERVVGNFRRVCNEVGDPTNLAERRDRFGEEAMEIFQSLDGTHEAARQIVDYVFGREKGQPRKEIGQGLVTLAALATHAGHDLMTCGEEELARLWQPEVIEKIRRKRAARHGRGPLPGVDAALAAPRADSAERTAGEAIISEDALRPIVAQFFHGRMRAVLGKDKCLPFEDETADWWDDADCVIGALAEEGALSRSPAPSSPGVPDSVRALSEAAWKQADTITERLMTLHWRPNRSQIEDARNTIRKLCKVLTLSHPAGQSDDDAERCIACDKTLKAGERVLSDAEGGTIHTACCGPEREGYTKGNGEPLGPNDPIPQGYVYEPERPAGQSTGQGPSQRILKPNTREEWLSKAEKHHREDMNLGVLHEELPDLIAALAAPDSTRTGQVETEEAWEALQQIKNTGRATRLRTNSEQDWKNAVVRMEREAEAALAARPAAPEAQGAETFETIAQWGEDTFGPIKPERVISRTKEEMAELEADPSDPVEVADMVICLMRFPGVVEAIQGKMTVNRKRRWRLMGDGTGYHIKDAPPASSGQESAR